ncbi:MAG: 30S ribosomal protein S4 [Euryarchaeota archaeon]|jgi:small subunit ribosomal protein S4|nr:30S ribosomal protein S4 [Euryarchaeota archaeon]|tara:strand:- start:639 stop:1322 length:684 start_codon:yes stop_codon:yes gene_type:complete
MGQPKFSRPKTQTPTHPWKAERIEEEHALKDQYGLKRVGGMKEIWRERSALRRHRQLAMKLIGRVDTSEGHFKREKEEFLGSMQRKGLISEDADLDDVLQISVENMLDRRLQSQVYYKGFAPSMRAARNMIVHGHIVLGNQKMNVPGYHVLRNQEADIAYHPSSNFNDPNHVIRQEMDRRRQTVGGEESAEVTQQVRDAHTDEEFIEQIKADEAAMDAAQNEDGGEA